MNLKYIIIGSVTTIFTIASLFLISIYICRNSNDISDTNDFKRYNFLSILPPFVAIILAFVTKQTVISLFVGVLMGEFMKHVENINILFSLLKGFLDMSSRLIDSLADAWNAGVLLQCLLISGVIRLITKMGGGQALAMALAKRANTPLKAQLTTELIGFFVFFDDYANSFIIGPIMRPVMDKLRVSREKLAFLVDATAAPVAGIALISTWIGLEDSLITEGYKSIGRDVNGFGIFIKTIPYRFYNILILIFIVMIAVTKLEFGPMKEAEIKARKRESDTYEKVDDSHFEEINPKEGVKLSIWNAVIPILTLIISALLAFYWSGYSAIISDEDNPSYKLMKKSPLSLKGIFEAFAASDASIALFQADLLASIVAICMALFQKIMSMEEAINEWVNGMKMILITGVILLLAWSLGSISNELGTAQYLVNILKKAIPSFVLPSLIFVLSSVISFSTGTSYGTMSILMPLTIPLAWAIKPEDNYVVICISGVLTGSIFGDHCSPISDTTILSSMASGCNHISHVRSQIFYALYVAIISIICGYLPAGFGIRWYITLPFAIVIMAIGLIIIGKKVQYDIPIDIETVKIKEEEEGKILPEDDKVTDKPIEIIKSSTYCEENENMV
ncbi:transporter Na+/H+ antiporter family [Anaeromyces robustus]|uniref:Transporter Na+/H+ antiporter family n=1 Tax=Anaeromyces robustus TaxID=1754192 RepID=A0A1Y1WVD7_9FUNG|nr:transporter Na+/H+ antiporter family [Anaeromyces robustus]|eukprot:ORX77268.1 transporter Na+/H+ antiporter family [Anaeromyces robustus]